MKVSDLKEIVTTNELLEILLLHSKGDEISRDDIAQVILGHQEKEKYIQLFLRETAKSTNSVAIDLESTFVKFIHNKYHGKDRDLLCEKTNSLYNKIVEKDSIGKIQSLKFIENAEVPFSEISKEFEKCVRDKNYLKSISQAVKNFGRSDFDTQYDFIRCKEQLLVVAALPKTPEKAKEYIERVLLEGGFLFVSCHETDEPVQKCKDFWKNKEVHTLLGQSGIRVQSIKEEVIAAGKENTELKKTPKLIETTIELEDGKKLYHLHFDNWEDKMACPDEHLLEVLLKRMNTLSADPKNPIAVNCKGGCGRSGAVAAAYLAQKQVDQQLQDLLIPLEKVKVNIPKMIYDMRVFRNILCSNPLHIQTVYSRNAAYYNLMSKK